MLHKRGKQPNLGYICGVCVSGTSYLQQFCTSVVNAIVSPFVLLDIAMESASFLAANGVSQVTQQIRLPLLNSLLQKCLQMYASVVNCSYDVVNYCHHCFGIL